MRVVDDQRSAPTRARDIAVVSADSLACPSFHDGVFHLTAAGGTTWRGFARAIFRARGVDTRLVPVESGEYPAAAARPLESLLSTAKFRDEFGFSLSDWLERFQKLLICGKRRITKQ